MILGSFDKLNPESVLLYYYYFPQLTLLFDLGFTARPDYFTHFEPSQSVGRTEIGDPRVNTT